MNYSGVLNDDVLLQIFDVMGKSSILNASLVCKTWHDLAQQIIDRTINLTLAEVYAARNLRLFGRIISDEVLRRRIHRIFIRDWHHSKIEEFRWNWNWPWLSSGYFSKSYNGPDQEWWLNTREQVDGLVKCLEVLTLTSFTWEALPPLPKVLVKTLKETQPDCAIEVIKNAHAMETALWAYTPYLNHHLLSTLHQLSNIAKLDLLIAAIDTDLLPSLGSLIASHPKLRTLKLKALGNNWSGSQRTWEWKLHPSRMTDRDFLVQSMSWLRTPIFQQERKLQLRELSLSNFCICSCQDKIVLDDLVDLTSLVFLEIGCFGFLDGCNGAAFVRLKHLSFGFRNPCVLDREKCIRDWNRETVEEFLQDCKNIHTLQLIDRADVLSENILSSIGQNLMSIDVHKTIPMDSRQHAHRWVAQHPAADVCGYPEHLIDSIARHCKRLEHLCINVAAEWPKFDASLESIAFQIPSLRRLHVLCMRGPSKLPGAEYEQRPSNRSEMKALLSHYHQFAKRFLERLTFELQKLSEADRYEFQIRTKGVWEVAFVAAVDHDKGGGKIPNAIITMPRLEDAERAKREKAPGDVNFIGICGSLRKLFTGGQQVSSIEGQVDPF